MSTKLDHIRSLIHFANLDHEFHEKEKEFILGVGERLGLEKETVEDEISNPKKERPEFPTDSVLRFILLDDIFNVVVADGELRDTEITECKKVAKDFGFDEGLIDVMVGKLKTHIQSGHVSNKTKLLVKNELFKLTSKNFTDAKYN